MMLTQNDSSYIGFSRFASMFRPCCWEHLRIRSSVPSIISAMAGIGNTVEQSTVDGKRDGKCSRQQMVDRAAKMVAGNGQNDVVVGPESLRPRPSAARPYIAAKTDRPGPLVFPIELSRDALIS